MFGLCDNKIINGTLCCAWMLDLTVLSACQLVTIAQYSEMLESLEDLLQLQQTSHLDFRENLVLARLACAGHCKVRAAFC